MRCPQRTWSAICPCARSSGRREFTDGHGPRGWERYVDRAAPMVTPTVLPARIPSAIRPWIPGYSGTRQHKAARPGTDTKQPPLAKKIQLAGIIAACGR
jgi:hypothetical protein